MEKEKSKNYISGLLVLFLMYAHVPAVLEMMNIPFYDSSAHILYYPRFYFFNSIYLTCFFVLEGMYSSFGRPLKDQVINDLRKYILPCIVVGIIAVYIKNNDFNQSIFLDYIKQYFLLGPGDYYVIYMLFGTRLLYTLFLKIESQRIRFSVLIAMSLFGCLVNNHINGSYRFWEQAFVLLPFLEVGAYCKDIVERNNWKISTLLIYVFMCLALYMLCMNLPYIHDGGRLSIKLWPLYLIMGSIGSIMLISLCKNLSNKLVEFVGENMISYILVHVIILILLIRTFNPYIKGCLESFTECTLMVTLLFLAAMLFSTLVAILFKYTFLKRLFIYTQQENE